MTSRIFRMVNQPTREQNWVKVCDAITRNNIQELKRLLDSNVDPNFASPTSLHYLLPDMRLRAQVKEYVNSDRLTLGPLHVSVLLKNKEATELLLRHGADARATVIGQHSLSHSRSVSTAVCSPIHLSVVVNDTTILKSLIDHAPGNWDLLNQRDVYGLTALDQAFKHAASDCALLLIQAGAGFGVDENNASLLTVCDLLVESCGKKDFALLNMILDCGYSGGGDILSAFLIHMTIDDDCDEAIQTFDKIVARYDFIALSRTGRDQSNYMHLAAEQQSVSMMQKLSAMSVKLETNLCGENPLHFAVREDHNTRPCMQYLTSLGCDVNQADVSGHTPLVAAIDCGNCNAILCLLDADCSCPTSSQGYTYLHLFCNSGATDLLVLRKLATKCDVNATTKFNWTALHLNVERCISSNQRAVVAAMDELIKLGADPLVRNSAGDTILTIAVLRGLSEVIHHITATMDGHTVLTLLNTADSAGLTPLHIAILNPGIRKETIVDLISHGADVNARDNAGRTTLFFLFAMEYAMQQSDDFRFGSRRISSDNDPVIRFKSVLKRRNIFSYSLHGSFDCLRTWTVLDHMLNETDVDINCRLTQANDTPLNIAFARGEYALMKKLLFSCADISQLSGSKFTPQKGMLDMCKLLDRLGFDDFDPILLKLREVQSDKYRMHMASAAERQEIRDLDEFLEVRKKKVPELRRMTANVLRRMHNRRHLKQLFSHDHELNKYIWN